MPREERLAIPPGDIVGDEDAGPLQRPLPLSGPVRPAGMPEEQYVDIPAVDDRYAVNSWPNGLPGKRRLERCERFRVNADDDVGNRRDHVVAQVAHGAALRAHRRRRLTSICVGRTADAIGEDDALKDVGGGRARIETE